MFELYKKTHLLLVKLTNCRQRLISNLLYNWRFRFCGKSVVIGFSPRLVNPHLIRLGYGISIGPLVRLEVHPQGNTGASLSIGNNTRIEHGVHIYVASDMMIGDFVMIASGCLVSDNNHGLNPAIGPYICQPLAAKRTIIGNNVWLGENVAVLAGVTIGDNAIIGSNSVVTRDIPANTISVGIPAVPIKSFNLSISKWEAIEES